MITKRWNIKDNQINKELEMKLKLFMRPLAVLAIAGVLVSCGEKETPIESGEDDKTETVDPTPEPEPEPEPELGQTFKYVNFCADRSLTEENFGDVSDGVIPVEWTKNDKVTVYSANTKGAKSERFTCKASTGNASVAEYTTTSMEWNPGEAHQFYAVYPATSFASDASLSLHLNSFQSTSGTDLPDLSETRMLAALKVDSPTDDVLTLSFKPAYSLLDIMFTASEEVTVNRIVVSSTDGTPVVGGYKVKHDGTDWVYTPDAEGVSSRMAIQVNGKDGLKLSSGASAHFYALLMPLNYSGLKVDILTPEGKVVEKVETSSSFAPSRRYEIAFESLPALGTCPTTYGKWMDYLPDNILVSDLSIPGSHDAATSSISISAAKCQGQTISNQLAGGVRLFDLRPDGSDLVIKHSYFSTNVTLSQALGYMKTFVTENPSEGCIAFIKEENSWTAENVSPALAEYKDNIVNFSAKLTIGQLRGKILVVSRTNYPGTIYGGNFSKGWPDNATDGSVGIGYEQGTATETFYLQDQYASSVSKETKYASFKAYADKARTSKSSTSWLCNHVSLSGSPKSNAQTLNPQAAEYISANPGRTAIVMMDFCCDASAGGEVLVNAVINQNVRYVQGVK